MNAIELCERGYIPDLLARWGMRRLCRQRLLDEQRDSHNKRKSLVDELQKTAVAINTDEANDQHYELPPGFFKLVLGQHLKYSSAIWPDEVSDLDTAEAAMLAQTCEHAGLTNGQNILELGCGWGSLTLWMARHYPDSNITAVSNSQGQRQYIEAVAKARGLSNIKILTTDVNHLDISDKFDRVVSVEMFEHVRNYAQLLQRIRGWLKPQGKLFVHIFCHRSLAYPYEDRGESDWMTRTFFTGGMMPSFDLFEYFDQDMKIQNRWWFDGVHYERTSNAWLDNMDANRKAIKAIFDEHYGKDQSDLWVQRWRMFFMAVAELFGYDEGREWGVGHYLFTPSS